MMIIMTNYICTAINFINPFFVSKSQHQQLITDSKKKSSSHSICSLNDDEIENIIYPLGWDLESLNLFYNEEQQAGGENDMVVNFNRVKLLT